VNVLASPVLIGLGVALALALLIGLPTGTLGWCLLAVACMALFLLIREARALLRWSKHPLRRPRNKDSLWDAATHRIYLQLQRERARTKDVLEQLRGLQVVTEALPDGAIVLDSQGEIDHLNRSARQLLNLKKADKGQILATLVRQPELVALLKDGYEENLVELTMPVANAAGVGARTKQIEVRKFYTEDERSTLLIRDVTELNRLLSMRQEFIANVSHELRTPLTVIVGYLETLQEESLERDTILDLVQRLRPPAVRMHALVDDLLLLTRLESAAPPAKEDLDPISVRDMLEQIISEAQVTASSAHNIQLEFESTARVYGVESELYSCFSNLVTNAVRYSPAGGVIKVSWQDTDAGVRYRVVDQGTGIAPEHLSRLTERFYRVDLTSARVRGGTGLGLAIVKHVLKRHNSSLSITSELGTGSEFTCLFPEKQIFRSNHNQSTLETQ
jgi:two-component system phosphate regulon sensor histidine kinase PhoR